MNSIRRRAQARKGYFICLVIGALLVGTVRAQAAPVDVGLVTKLSGEATYWNRDEQKEPVRVQAFMKVRQGDYLKLPPEGLVQLVYFDNGRQETWRGPVTVTIGLGASRAEGEKGPQSQPEVQTLPTKVSKRMLAPGMPLPRSSMRYSGVIQTMAPECKTSTPAATCVKPLNAQGRKEIKEAQKVYQSLRQQTDEGDLTPEFYLLSVLADYGQYPQMLQTIDSMLTKKPGDPVLKDLKTWVRSQPAPPGGPASP